MMRTLQSRDSYLSVLSYRAGLYHNWHVFETRLLNAPLQKLSSKALHLKSRINIHTVKLPEVSQSCIWWNCQLVNDVLDSRYPSLVEYRIIYGGVAPIFEICLRDRCVSQIPVIKRCITFNERRRVYSLVAWRSVCSMSCPDCPSGHILYFVMFRSRLFIGHDPTDAIWFKDPFGQKLCRSSNVRCPVFAKVNRLELCKRVCEVAETFYFGEPQQIVWMKRTNTHGP